MNLYVFLSIWFFLWFSYHGLLNLFLIPNGFSFRKKGYLVSILALFFVNLIYWFYNLRDTLKISDLVIPTVLAIAFHFGLKPINKLFVKNPRVKSPLLPRYIDVLFQQLMILSLTIFLANSFKNIFPLIVGFVFATGHMPILFFDRVKKLWKFFIISFGFFGGIIFSYLSNKFTPAIPITMHITLYYLLAILTPDEDSILP